MADQESEASVEPEMVIVERRSGGGVVVAIALLIAIGAVLYYLDVLRF
jgi:hypothetical protein